MSCKQTQISVTSIPETNECDLSKRKDSPFLILESNKDISLADELFYGLRSGLISNCSDYNPLVADEKLKELALKISPGPDFPIIQATSKDDQTDEKAQAQDLMQILEKSRQLNKENLQVIDGVQILLSGKGGRPFAKLENDRSEAQETRSFDPETRVKTLAQLDELLMSVLKCTAEVERLGQVNASLNIRCCPNSYVHRKVNEIRDQITALYLGPFKGTQNI